MAFKHTQQETPLPTTGMTSYTTTVPTPAGYLAPAGVNAPFASGNIAPPTGPIRKKPKPAAKTKSGNQLSKSLSTPQLRGPIMSDSELDKKRNKLGYQRISIACDEDPEGRCQNCIRLKKDCVFYPVDQQAALDARSESLSKPSVVPSAPSSTVSSSPSHGDVRTAEQQGHRFSGGFQHIPSSVGSGAYQGIPIAPSTALQPQSRRQSQTVRSEYDINGRSGNYAPPEPRYSAQPEATPPWTPQEFGQSNPAMSIRGSSIMPQPWPRYGASNATADAASFPRPADNALRNLQPAQSFSYVEQQWPAPQQNPPVRSMSVPGYSHHELHPAYHPGQQPPEAQIRNAYTQQHSEPHLVPILPTQPAYHVQSSPYVVQHDQRSLSIPFVHHPYQQAPSQMQPSWYGNTPAFNQGEEPRAPHNQQANYSVPSS